MQLKALMIPAGPSGDFASESEGERAPPATARLLERRREGDHLLIRSGS